jgi:hypothetical protein
VIRGAILLAAGMIAAGGAWLVEDFVRPIWRKREGQWMPKGPKGVTLASRGEAPAPLRPNRGPTLEIFPPDHGTRLS